MLSAGILTILFAVPFTINVVPDSAVVNVSVAPPAPAKVEATYDTRPTFRVSVDNSTFAGAGGATDTLTTAESGTTFVVNGTANNVVNMPALSTDNVGTTYHFVLTTSATGLAAVPPTSWIIPKKFDTPAPGKTKVVVVPAPTAVVKTK